MNSSSDNESKRRLAELLHETESCALFEAERIRSQIRDTLASDGPMKHSSGRSYAAPDESATPNEARELDRQTHRLMDRQVGRRFVATALPSSQRTTSQRTIAWALRIAAAVAFFTLGLLSGRGSVLTPVTLVSDTQSVGESAGAPLWNASAVPKMVNPSELPFSIQTTGTGYVSSLSLLSEMKEQLSPTELQQAREVAVAVLSGAIAELLVSTDGASQSELMEVLAGRGPSSEPGRLGSW